MSEARSIEDVLRDPASTAEIQRAVDAFDRRTWSTTSRVHVLRNFTVENALPALRFAGYRRDIKIDATLSAFDGYRQDALTRNGSICRAEAVILWLWLDSMPMAWDAQRTLDVGGALDELFGLVENISKRSSAPILVHTFAPPAGAGSNWEGHDALDALNTAVRERARSDKRVVVVDVARMVADLGRAEAFDARFGLMHDAPLSSALARAWGDAVAQIIAARSGRVRKVLVVDADETLWGGIVGEDSVNGIRLSRHSYPGNAYYAFQRQLLALRQRGVLLALASKNDPESVFEVLDTHPDSLLRREHFSAIRIGWGPKSQAIREMAEELRLGLDAFVFVDDSPVECAEVRTALPMVEVIRVPREAFRVPSLLANVRFFDAPTRAPEDALRADHYAQEERRNQARKEHTDLESFLTSLELEATIGPPTKSELDRVAQLTHRTNQWNLTTKRYDVARIAEMAASDRFMLVALRVRDRYGDYGLTGLGIAELDEAGNVSIDTLLMSCRTLGRRLEDVLLAELVSAIRSRAPNAEVRAEFRPTKKNSQVERFYDERGFVLVDASSTSSVTNEPCRSYILGADRNVDAPSFIRIRRTS